jgi:hypothetical protein
VLDDFLREVPGEVVRFPAATIKHYTRSVLLEINCYRAAKRGVRLCAIPKSRVNSEKGAA